MGLSKQGRLMTTCTCGFLFVILGLVIGLVVRHRVHSGINSVAPVCGVNDDSFESFASNRGEDEVPKFKLYYSFSATNAVEYLAQVPGQPKSLQLEMKGPYALRQFEDKFDIRFNGANTQVTYDTLEQYDFTPGRSCADCREYDTATNLNPVLLKAMGQAGSEFAIALGMSATDTAYLVPRAVPVCTRENIAYTLQGCNFTSDTSGKCCCDTTPRTSFNTQDDFFSCAVRAGRASGVYSTMAKFDGGIAFPSPTFQGESVTSPLFITKNLHEVGFGYPSAVAGMLGGLQAAQLPEPNKTATLTKLAMFTMAAQSVCSFNSSGTAPHPDQLAGSAVQFLGGITCAPLDAVKYWAEQPTGVPVKRCAILGGNNETKGCTCVLPHAGTNGLSTPEAPCCTTSGLGCLAPVPGYVTPVYMMNEAHARSVSPGTTTQFTGCSGVPSGAEFDWVAFEGNPDHAVFSRQDRSNYTSPTMPEIAADAQQRVAANFLPPRGYTAPVQGNDGTRFAGTGKTSSAFSFQLSDGTPFANDALVYITQVKRAAKIFHGGAEDLNGVTVNRFAPSDTLLSQNEEANPPALENLIVGAGTPMTGVQDISYLTGFNTYVSMPLFLNGDEDLLTQTAGCEAQPPTTQACAGINLTRAGDLEKMPLKPNKDQHGTFLLVESASGMTLAAHKRLQASFATFTCQQGHPGCTSFGRSFANLLSPGVPGSKIIPQYWMDETATAEDKQINRLRSVMRVNLAADAIMLVFPLVGALMVSVAVWSWYRSDLTSNRSTVGRGALLDQQP